MEWTYDKEKLAESYLTVGENYHYGEDQNLFLAFACYQKAAELGNAKAAIVLSEYYRAKGEYDEELKWLEKVNEETELPPEKAYRLGRFYQYGWEAAKMDWEKAHDLYEEASRGGNKHAQKTLKFWPLHKMGCIYRAVFEND